MATKSPDAALSSSRIARPDPAPYGHGRAWAHCLRLASTSLQIARYAFSREGGTLWGLVPVDGRSPALDADSTKTSDTPACVKTAPALSGRSQKHHSTGPSGLTSYRLPTPSRCPQPLADDQFSQKRRPVVEVRPGDEQRARHLSVNAGDILKGQSGVVFKRTLG